MSNGAPRPQNFFSYNYALIVSRIFIKVLQLSLDSLKKGIPDIFGLTFTLFNVIISLSP